MHKTERIILKGGILILTSKLDPVWIVYQFACFLGLIFVLSYPPREAMVYAKRGPNRIGHVYKKALYRRYTDISFTIKANHSEYLGFLGPVIRAEVGETIKVVFKNMASRNYSVHPHGVFYE